MIDTNTKTGKLLETYVNLYSNRWNAECDICWFVFGQAIAGVVGIVVGAWLW